MHTRFALIALLFALSAVVTAADAPAPLVKPVTPASGVRVRVPVEEDAKTFMQFKALIAHPKGKKGEKGETIAVKVMVDTLNSYPRVELKNWKAWGFEVPQNRIGVIPEIVISGAQLSPKPAKGRDVEFRITNAKVTIVESAAGQDSVGGGCDILLGLRDITGGADRTSEPRVYFGDKFLELSAPNTSVKKLNTGEMSSPEPAATAGDLVPTAGTLTGNTSAPVFAFASVNSHTRYTLTTGKIETVNVGVSSFANYEAPGIAMTLNTALGCGVDMEKLPRDGALGVGKVKELRLEMLTGTGFKVKKDFVLKDVTVLVSEDKTNAFVWLGPRFVEKYIADCVYGCGSDGVWRMHGRVKAELLEDTKTRMREPPPKKP